MTTPILAFLLPLVLQADRPAAGDAQPAARPPLYDEAADAEREIAAALEQAARFQRRVLIQWGANWCGWCQLLHQTFASDPEIHRLLEEEYDLVLVDVGHRDKNTDLAARYGADLDGGGLPYLTVLDREGRVVANQETGSLERAGATEKGHDPERVKAFLDGARQQGRSAKLYVDGAKARARAQGKSLFVHFGAEWCGNCRQLERWLRDPEVAPLFRRDFVELEIDIEKVKGGMKLLDKLRTGERGGIPWFVCFDKDGARLLDSNRPDGKNVGYPKQGENAVHFRTMIEKAKVSLTGDEIDVLVAALARY